MRVIAKAPYIKKRNRGTGEIVHQLRALVLSEDQGSTPNTYMVAHKHLKLQFQRIGRPLLVSADTAYTWCTDSHAGKTLICKIKSRKFLKKKMWLVKKITKQVIHTPRCSIMASTRCTNHATLVPWVSQPFLWVSFCGDQRPHMHHTCCTPNDDS